MIPTTRRTADFWVMGALLSAVAWGLTTGGTSAGDLACIAVLLVGTTCILRSRHLSLPALGSLVALVGSFAAIGVVHVGLSLASVRVPALLVIACLAYILASKLPAFRRAQFLDGLIALGVAHAAVAITQATIPFTTASTLDGYQRAAGLIGSPNALGAFLLVCVLLTMRRAVGGGAIWHAALAVQLGGLFATGSRLALFLAVVALVASRTRLHRRLPVSAIAWMGASMALVAVRSVADPLSRFELWAKASERIMAAPVIGGHHTGDVLAITSPNTPPTPYAHNELLQLAMEYGIPVTAILLGALAWTLRGVVRGPIDGWIISCVGVLILSGLVDVTLRVTPMLIVLAVLVAFTRTRPVATEVNDLESQTSDPLQPAS